MITASSTNYKNINQWIASVATLTSMGLAERSSSFSIEALAFQVPLAILYKGNSLYYLPYNPYIIFCFKWAGTKGNGVKRCENL
jgi:hypothetical protein